MNKVGKKILAGVMTLGLILSAASLHSVQAEAHHGGGHRSGCYNSSAYDNNYYCGGHAAHQHNNGVCPYTDYYCGGHAAHQHNNGVCPYTDYYCGGHAAHQHVNGVCPYSQETAANAAEIAGSAQVAPTAAAVQPEKTVDAATVKQLQQKLSDAGYSCGQADGVWGQKSKAALTSYQTDHSLTSDGCIRDEVLNSLGITQ